MTLASEIAADSPWGYWKLDDASGTNVVDSSGNSHPATLTGTPGVTYAEPELASGLGNCMKLIGNDNPQVTLPSGFNNSPFTFEAIIKPTDITISEQGFFTAGGASEFILRMSGSGKANGSIQMGINGTRPATSTGVLANNVAHHIAFTYPNSGAASVIYLDGVATTLDASGVMSTNQTLAGTANLFHNNAKFKGWIQHCAVYTSELSAARILAHATAAGFVTTSTPSPAHSRLKRPRSHAALQRAVR